MINKKGFTLIELLVVVLMIGALATIALPKFNKANERTNAIEALKIINDVYTAQKVRMARGNPVATSWSDLSVDVKNITIIDAQRIKSSKFRYTLNADNISAERNKISGPFSYVQYTVSKFYATGVVTCEASNEDGEDVCGLIESL